MCQTLFSLLNVCYLFLIASRRTNCYLGFIHKWAECQLRSPLFPRSSAYRCLEKTGIPGSLAGGLKGHPLNPMLYFQGLWSPTDPHLNCSCVVNADVKLTKFRGVWCGQSGPFVRVWVGAVLGLMFFCCCLDILINLGTRGPAFSLSIESCKFCSSSWYYYCFNMHLFSLLLFVWVGRLCMA